MMTKKHWILLIRLAFSTCCLCIGKVPSLSPQDKLDRGPVYYQLNYRPGDWITYSNHRFVTAIAIGFRKAYVGTTGGLLRIDLNTKRFDYPLTTSDHLLDSEILCVAADKGSQLLWIASRSGLHTYDEVSQWMTSASNSQVGLIMGEVILSIGFQVQTVWLQTSLRYLKSEGSLLGFSESQPPVRTVEWYGQLGERDLELPVIHPKSSSGFDFFATSASFVNREFYEFPISCFARDNAGDFWIGTSGAGLWYAKSVSGLADRLTYGLFSEDVACMIFDGDNLILGGRSQPPFSSGAYGGGITVWRQPTDEFEYDESGFGKNLRADKLRCLLTDSSSVWAGTEDGLFRLDKADGLWTAFRPGLFADAFVLSLASVREGYILAGTTSGLGELHRDEETYVASKNRFAELQNTSIYKIHIDGPVWWLCTSNGIFRINPFDNQVSHFNAMGFQVGPMTYTAQDVHAVADDDSNLYFASQEGVVQFDKRLHLWKGLPVPGSFLSQGVHDAKADADNLWIATKSGVLRYVKRKKKWIYYGIKDGMPHENVQCILLDGDFVWFGTPNGVTQFFWNAPHLTD